MLQATLFCATCRRHYPGARTICPADGARLVPVPSGRLQMGAVIDERYLLLEELAVGGMASIYRALDRTDHSERALKLLQNRFLTTPLLVDQFYQEARIIRLLDHPHVVRMYDFGRTAEGYLYIAMELLHGPTLAEYLWERPPLPFDVGLRIFFQIADALRAAHARGVIHADLKASNVLFLSPHPEDERVKVLDFGIARLRAIEARAVREGGEELPVLGTPEYMSPEQIAGEEIDPRTDLYSAGVLLFQILTGRLPFVHPDPAEICRMHREVPAPRLSSVLPSARFPVALEQLVERLLRKDPEARPTSAKELYEETKEVLRRAGSPTQPLIRGAPVALPPGAGEGRGPSLAPGFTTEPLGPGLEALALAAVEEARAASSDAAEAVQRRELTLLDLELLGDDRPFSLLDPHTLALVGEPLVDALVRELRAADGLLLERDAFRIRVAFGLQTGDSRQGGVAVDLALALLGLVDGIEADLQIGLAVRGGIATGPLFLDPRDRLSPGLLVRGALPDIAARLVRMAPWGGLVVDHTTYRARAHRLPGARPLSVPARRRPDGLPVYEFRRGR